MRASRRRSLPNWPPRASTASKPVSRHGASKDFTWSTLDSRSATRRVIGKAEWTGGKANPRFVVTSLARREHEARHLYEKVYCARGDMENRIKECQTDLFADRTSAKTMRANQLRLWVRGDGLCAGLRLAPDCPAAHAVCRGDLRYDPPQAVQDRRAGASQRPPHQDRDGLRLSLPKRVRPRPFALDRRRALTRNRRRDIPPRSAGPHCARHDSPRLRAGALATIPCTARTTASN